MSSYDNNSLFMFLTHGAVGDKILIKCEVNQYDLEEEDIAALMEKNITDVSVKYFDIDYYY